MSTSKKAGDAARTRDKPGAARKAKASSAPKPSAGSGRKPQPRADYGAPVDGFFAKQLEPMRGLLNQLRELIEAAVPGAESSLKWGMPFYTRGGKTVCALGAHKAHVNLILSGPPGTFADPKALLEGDGKTGRRLKLTPGSTIPVADVRRWLRAAAALAD